MSLHDLAIQIKSKGRGDDTMLVHMTPGEVHGLQSLALSHGGSLTINPDTGLPEAGFLKSLLPMLIGAVLTPLTGGLINPMTAGLLVGGVEGLRTGDIGKGLMAGLGAYGGAGLSAGLSGLGGAASAAGKTASLANIPGASAGTFAAQSAAVPGLTTAGIGSATSAIPGATVAMNPAVSQAISTASPSFSTIGQGLRSLGNAPLEGIKQIGQTMGAKQVGALGASVAGAMSQPGKAPDMTKPQTEFYNTTYSPGTVNPKFGQPGESYFVGQGYGPGTRSKTYQEPAYVPPPGSRPQPSGMLTPDYLANYMQQPSFNAAEGGPVPMPVPSYPMSGITQPGYSQPLNFSRPTEVLQDYEPKVDTYTGQEVRMAGGGLASLGTYSDGGQLLKGPGDGMSDDIPAMIEGEQPQKAALADGEFVVPADVVSGIGNGSTEAGSRRLYEMMDRVRMARTGREKQAPEIEAGKYLPA
jgi:hypothetical protein